MYNIYEKQTDKQIRNAQIVYMAKVLNMTVNEIAGYVNLTVRTVREYIRKFAYLLDQAKEWFERQVDKVKDKIKGNDRTIIYEKDCKVQVGDCSYIIEYFDSQNNFQFLKVGMTNNIKRRISEHFREYGVAYAIVKELHYAVDEEDALTLENLYRKHYKAIENCGFIRRDRFTNVRYNKADLEKDTDLMSKVQLFEMAVV